MSSSASADEAPTKAAPFVGDYSLADICYAPVVTVLDRVRLGDLVNERPAVRAWVERLLARPAVRDTEPPPIRL